MTHYIDANKLMKYAQNNKDKTIDCNDIARFPCEDVAPVIHGAWRHGRETGRKYCGDALIAIYYQDWKCSECGYKIDDHEYSCINYKYCPNCGAKMESIRKEEHDDDERSEA